MQTNIMIALAAAIIAFASCAHAGNGNRAPPSPRNIAFRSMTLRARNELRTAETRRTGV